MLIDSHCHLDAQYYPDGCDVALDRARAEGVEGFVAIGVGEDLGPARAAIAVAARRPDVWASVGLHPHDARCLTPEMEAELRELAKAPRVVAFGEIGLDYHYMHSPRDKQAEVFRRMIAIAKEAKLPIVVHTREAAADTLSILDEENARDVGGIIHCFSEDRPFAQRALDLDFDLSFSGVVTFKNAVAIKDVAAWAPADRILVETDSPYLAPIPFRGKKCEPAHVAITARCLADLRGVSLEEVARISSENTRRRLRLS